MVMSTYQQRPGAVIAMGLLLAGLNSIAFFELGRELGHAESEDDFLHRQLRAERRLVDCGGHPKKMYGHVHMAKTGGTSVNGILANRYERVCGNKGYSYDAFRENRLMGLKEKRGEEIHPGGRSNPSRTEMEDIGFEDCDYVSKEANEPNHFWTSHFGDHSFHGVEFELHVPCRDPIDHLMSQCNYYHHPHLGGKSHLNCDAETDEEFFASVEACYVNLGRYDHSLKDHFDVKCYDFKQQFTTYMDYMDTLLEEKRVVPTAYVKRETNDPRDKDSECIWKRPDLMEKTRKYLIETVPYYNFCDACLGSEDDLTRGGEMLEEE